MRHYIAGAAIFLFGIQAAFAQDAGMIVIKKKDGTVTEYQIPEDQPRVAPAAPVREDLPATDAVPEAPKAKPAPAAAAKKTARPAMRKPVRDVFTPVPPRKPLLPVAVKKVAAALPEGYAIPRNMAIAVAIEQTSSPARDFTVVRRVYKNIPVYAVVFRTEGGEETVMIDARDGSVVAGN